MKWILRCLALLCSVSSLLPAAEKPNILLILADDLGWKDVGWMDESKFIETPQLDRLRKESMTFPQAYAAAGNCAPSRACLLSGKYTPRHGVYAVGDTDRGPKDRFRLRPIPNNPRLAPSLTTVAEALKAQGYVTGHFGKWHLGAEASGTGPRQQGFDVSPPGLIPAGAQGENEGEDQSAKAGRSTRRSGHMDDPKKVFAITQAASDFMEANRGRPFFAYVAHHAVHTALQARPATLARFEKKAETTKQSHVKPLYAACIAELDEGVGLLLKKLADLRMDSQTLVMFTSDNGGTGPSLNEPLRGAKGGYYEGGIREPFLVRWPSVVRPGSQCDVPIINVDLYPTFVAAAGGTPAPDLDGESLLPLFQGANQLRRSALFWHFPGYLDNPVPRGRDPVFRTRPISVVRQGDWKLHLYHEEWLLDGGRAGLTTNRAVELYNLAADIGERTDLALKETRKRDQLLDLLLAWIRSANAPLPATP